MAAGQWIKWTNEHVRLCYIAKYTYLQIQVKMTQKLQLNNGILSLLTSFIYRIDDRKAHLQNSELGLQNPFCFQCLHIKSIWLATENIKITRRNLYPGMRNKISQKRWNRTLHVHVWGYAISILLNKKESEELLYSA